MTTPSSKAITIYAMPGSQFVFKVLAALGHLQIPYTVKLVSFLPNQRKKVIPSGGLMVPEMTVEGAGIENRIIVKDSEAILHWIDENYQAGLFPNEQASELSVRASDKTLAAMVWYYNWVDEAGYKASMQRVAAEMLPSFIFFRNALVNFAVSSKRTKYKNKVKETLNVDDAVLKDEPHMRKLLVHELKYFQSFLTDDSKVQPYLLPGDQPTAADFSVYAQVDRLVDGKGVSSDVKIFPSIPKLKEDNDGLELKRLWEWHDLMRVTCPVAFKGKDPASK